MKRICMVLLTLALLAVAALCQACLAESAVLPADLTEVA